MADSNETHARKHPDAAATRQGAGATERSVVDEHDLANEKHGNNRLQGADQSQVRNERSTQPNSLNAGNQPSDSPVEESRRHDKDDH